MSLTRNKLYLLIYIACFAGYVWIYLGLTNDFIQSKSVQVCPIKYITNIPCPSCGSTRSVILLTQGNFIEAFRIKTGIPILLNTSFNENEPIVNLPLEALNCYLRTEMDMLVMENIVVSRILTN
jgi:hypothetical protein